MNCKGCLVKKCGECVNKGLFTVDSCNAMQILESMAMEDVWLASLTDEDIEVFMAKNR